MSLALQSPPDGCDAWDSNRQHVDSKTDIHGESSTAPFEPPVIDLAKSYSKDVADRQTVADQIRAACTSSGFFYITSHSVPPSNCLMALEQAQRLFKTLSRAEKEAIHVRHSPYYHGWEPAEATSIDGDTETKECYNFGYEARLDDGGDDKYVHIDGTSGEGNLWPGEEVLPGFVDAVSQYYTPVLQLARHLTRLFALSLKLPESYFENMITHPGGVARLMRYPPRKSPTAPSVKLSEGEMGLGAHSDYQCFTILLSSSTPGLEIMSPNDGWICAPVVENSLIVNVGDFLMRLTNDLYKSTIHRVVNRSDKERHSVPFFFSFNHDLVVETLPSCVSADNPAKYPPINAGEYIMQRLALTKKNDTVQF